MECGAQVGVGRSVQASQADATRMHVTSGFCPEEGAKHDLGARIEGTARGEGEAGGVGASREAGSREGLRRRLRSWQAGELKWNE